MDKLSLKVRITVTERDGTFTDHDVRVVYMDGEVLVGTDLTEKRKYRRFRMSDIAGEIKILGMD